MFIGLISCEFGWEEEQFQQIAKKLGHSLEFVDPTNLVVSALSSEIKADEIGRFDRILIRRTLEAKSAIASISGMIKRIGIVTLERPDQYLRADAGKATGIIERVGRVPIPNSWFLWKRGKLAEIIYQLPLPVICKPNLGRQGKGIQVAYEYKEIEYILEQHLLHSPNEPFIIQELLVIAREYRVLILGKRILGTYLKEAIEGKHVRNAAAGSVFRKVGEYEVSTDELQVVTEMAVRTSHEISGIVFAGVDVVVDMKGDTYILECNRNPKFKAAQQVEQNIDIAREVIEFLVAWDGNDM